MNALRQHLFGDGHEYALIGQEASPSKLLRKKYSFPVLILVTVIGVVAVLGLRSSDGPLLDGIYHPSCDSIFHGYDCRPEISHFWGQYSPYFSAPFPGEASIPKDCYISFVQVLSRHGARDPTLSKTQLYRATVRKIQTNVQKFSGKYAFLDDYEYSLGADELTTFGQQQLVNSGIKFYDRYNELLRTAKPFVRASGQQRVIDSALNWTQGILQAKKGDLKAIISDDDAPHVDVIIPEDEGKNNSLRHGLCDEFENGPVSMIGDDAQAKWAQIFVPPIQSRLNKDLEGAKLTVTDTINLMSLCPFDTVASPTGKISAFCDLFDENEWHQYNYYETLGKYYGYGHGNPLGPSQGVGFVNELIARMTDSPVYDETSTNHTLDDSAETFPLGKRIYADFSHDNDMIAILAAFGFYKLPSHLPNITIVEAPEAANFSVAWTVPFASRMYFEKLWCAKNNESEEFVRVYVNDHRLPLSQCYSDDHGRCTLSNFTASLSFAQGGGHWDACFQ